jgi:phosphoserine aminotransferase
MSKQIHNFSAGPCILPKSVLEEASQAVIEFGTSGLSLIEMSHRSSHFEAVMAEARDLVKDLMKLTDNYEVLFLQGGATLGFLTAPYNFLPVGAKAAYVNTGTWAKGAIKEAKLLGEVEVVASSEAENHTYIPEIPALDNSYSYLHITSNNTIFGTQYKSFPKPGIPMICDMSSDIMSKEVDASEFDLIYAGAQKNMGPAGTVVYIVDKDKLGKTGRKIPTYLDLAQHIDKDSMLNTPPVFSVYVCMLTLRWLRGIGGVPAIAKINRAKADLMYSEIDSNPLFTGHALPAFRSDMNATFRLTDESLAPVFEKMLDEAGISGLKGHRSVGGYRASMYNALPLESVQVLVNIMKDLARIKG